MSGYVLIVDDEREIIRLIQATLDALGYRIVSATDGYAAMEYIRAEKPALILLDLMMPGMSGFQVLTKLHSDPELASIPVIVISAYAGERDAGDLPGVSRVLRKGNFGVMELGEVVSRYIAA